MGNFTTAYNAIDLGRKVIGFEMNKQSFDFHKDKIVKMSKNFGDGLKDLKQVIVAKPENQGQKISEENRSLIIKRYNELLQIEKYKKDVIDILCSEFGRGKFSITNIVN